ncbi:TolC family protein [Beijerinckia sp. L45]|uniref:TolC family protein n=1 Tax=Beijerinckia sp. L45 TaxID=1641855 RepID=UPI00131DE6E1|nr:TolC family protein [Beijerinckia sp. L45]
MFARNAPPLRLLLGLALTLTSLGGCAIVPHPLTNAERSAEADTDLAKVYADQEPLTHALTLQEAFARAMAYNLDERVKLMERQVAERDFEISKFDLLPKVIATAGASTRDNVLASSSISVVNSQVTVPPSTSSDRDLRFADLTTSWNILDFWVSYFNTKQQANRVLVAEEQRRRVLQALFQDVRRTFWRAASAQQLSNDIRVAIRDAQNSLESSRKSESLRAPIDALRYQKALLDSLRDLEFVQKQLAVGKAELAALINLPVGTNYSVAVPRTLKIEGLKAPIRQMEELALLHNPDIREASYQVRIMVDETHKMLARNLPGINFSYGPNYDSNSFLVNNSWGAGAVRLSGNLISVLSIPEQLKRGHLAEDTAITRRQALSVATLARLHIAYQTYLAAVEEYRWADQLADVDRKLYQQISNRTETDVQSELERVSARVSAVESDLRRYRSYAEAQAALGRLYDVVGIDPVPETLASLDIATLSAAIRRSASDWDNNRLSHASEAPAAAAPVSAAAGPADTRVAASAPNEAPQRSALAAEKQPVVQ